MTRAGAHALLWAILLVVALGAHASLHVCTGPDCGETAAAATDGGAESGCRCCREARAAEADAERGLHRAEGDDSCCIDLCMQLEPAPLPRRVAVDAGPGPMLAAAPAPSPVSFALPMPAPRAGAPATGPPRRDRRTLLLSTTVLRL